MTHKSFQTCPSCKGSSYAEYAADPCPVCLGAGELLSEKKGLLIGNTRQCLLAAIGSAVVTVGVLRYEATEIILGVVLLVLVLMPTIPGSDVFIPEDD